MDIYISRFPAGILILPNDEYFFGSPTDQSEWWKIAAVFDYGAIARIYVTNFGALGFNFHSDGPLAAMGKLTTRGSGIIPEPVMENHEALRDLQARRVGFANFISAALFGHLMAQKHTALSGARLAGLDTVLTFREREGYLDIEATAYTQQVVGPKAAKAKQAPNELRQINGEELIDAVAFVSALSSRESLFQYANLQTCMAMNYQAAILHNAQNAAASLALNFAVAEALIKEIFCAYGLVSGCQKQPFATTPHKATLMSVKEFENLRVARAITLLNDGGLINPYLGDRLHESRKLRNNLMHEAIPANLTQSGTMQTALRDLWDHLIDGSFELNASYSMRI